MDPAAVFYRSLGTGFPRPSQHFFPGRPPVPGPYPWDNPEQDAHDAPHRSVAHTLTACCRCRQRKTRCDPALPRCLPCERSGSTCEYYDSAKGKKINRTYVVSLQKKVRELEDELAQYTDHEGEYPLNHDDMVTPGGIVRLDETDEMPRYLGPSSGTAMTRLLMEEAKRYAESRRIANLIPAVLARRAEQRDRMQSVVMGGSISGPSGRKKSYPAHSIIPASSLPKKEIVVGLVRAFNDRVQLFAPILHEKTFEEDVDAVFTGDTDPYKHFTVNMVVAISLQKVGKYAGLPDSYYLNAMRRFEDVVRPQDLKTLQCLILIGQYALMTPTRTAVYYVIGLAARICQQMGLGDERTIGVGVTDRLTLDMRRRLSWIVTSHELALAFSMGRPNGFARSADLMNVKFFETAADEDITPEEIRPGSPCERKLVAIHFCRMRLLQAEIRRVLYEKKRPEPTHENHPWFAEMEQKLQSWLNACPEQPAWCRPFLIGYYHSMVIALYRPNPQVRRPTSTSAVKCFGASRYIIDATSQQIEQGTADITLDAIMIIYASLNALLWSISYPEVRAEHHREEVQDLAAAALEAIKLFSDRWPGSSSAVQLYTSLANACLQSYNVEEESPSPPSSSQLGTPVSRAGPISPESDVSRNTESSQAHPQSATSLFNAPAFGYVFNAAPDALAAHYAFDNGPSPFPHQPTFRSNSIFESPSTDSNGRRLSHLAPDFTPTDEPSAGERMPKQEPTPTATPMIGSLPTPPEPVAPPPIHHNDIGQSPSPVASTTQTATPIPTPTLHTISPSPIPHHTPVPIIQVQPKPQEFFHAPQFKQQHQQQQQQQQQQAGLSSQRPLPPTFITPPPQNAQQRLSRPTGTTTDWFSPLPQFVPPHAFVNGNNGPSSFWDSAPNPFAGLGLGLAGQRGDGTFTQGGPPSNTGYANPNAENNSWGYSWGTEAALPQAAGFAPGLGLAPGAAAAGAPASDYYNSFWNNARHGSLSQQEQLELMDVLETEGMNDIDSFLNIGDGNGGNGVAGWGQQQH